MSSETPEKKQKLGIYSVLITRAYPDYKRPYASATLCHFDSYEAATEFAMRQRMIYYNDYGVLDAFNNESDTQLTVDDDARPPTDDQLMRLEELAYDIVYFDSYMDMSPFDAVVSPVVPVAATEQ